MLEGACCYKSRSMFNIAQSIAGQPCSTEAEMADDGTIPKADYWI